MPPSPRHVANSHGRPPAFKAMPSRLALWPQKRCPGHRRSEPGRRQRPRSLGADSGAREPSPHRHREDPSMPADIANIPSHLCRETIRRGALLAQTTPAARTPSRSPPNGAISSCPPSAPSCARPRTERRTTGSGRRGRSCATGHRTKPPAPDIPPARTSAADRVCGARTS